MTVKKPKGAKTNPIVLKPAPAPVVYKTESIEDYLKPTLRDGIPLEKGVTITEDRAIALESLLRKYFQYWTVYPDRFLDTIKPEGSKFDLYFYQRIVLRALMRFRVVYVCAPRAFSKSFLAILALILKCIFQPGIKLFICAPKINQSVKIATEKVKEIFKLFPLLEQEVINGGNFSKDYITLVFKNSSIFDVVSTQESQRGGRRNALKNFLPPPSRFSKIFY